MPKNATSWSNNDVKPVSSWAGTSKNQSAWVNNVTKHPTSFTGVAKNSTAWGNEAVVSAAWLYDDPTEKYDNTPLRGYDYLIPVTNSLNGKNMTPWSVVV